MTPQSAEEELLQHQFPALDSMRAIGALAVFTTHVAFWSGAYTGNGVWGTLLARLDVGVAIFFVLSGFLLSRPFLARASVGRPRPALGRYYWKRFLRIAPLYVFTALLALAFVKKNAGLGAHDWLITLLMGDTFFKGTMPNGLTQMWSLAVEVSFYLVLPGLMALAVGRPARLAARRVVALVCCMIAVSVVWDLFGAPWAGSWTSGQPNQWLPSYLGWFGLGIALALVDLLHRQGRSPRVTAKVIALAQQPGSCWVMVAGALLVAATPIAGPSMLAAPTPGQLLTKNVLYGMVGGMLVLTGAFPRQGSTYARVLGSHPARHLGFISYGIFCLHLPVLHLVMWVTGWQLFGGHFAALWVTALAVSLVAAELSYRLIEVPAMKLKNLGRRPAAKITQATTGTSTR